MLNRYKFIIILIFISFLLIAFNGCSISTNYYPLKVGNEWVYSSDIGTDITLQVEGMQAIDGINCFVLTSYTTDKTKWAQKEYFAMDKNDVLCYRRDYEGELKLKLIPPEKMFSLIPEVGEKWTWDGKIEKLKCKFNFLIEKREKITLNIKGRNKTYNCLKLAITGVSQDGINYQTNRWYANRIGMIKETSLLTKGDKTLEINFALKDYRLK